MFYSAAAFSNIASTILGGIMIDKVGLRTVILVISIATATGITIFALGISIGSFGLSLLGRTIFGSGIQILDITENIFIIKWFTGKELSMGIGAKLSSTLFSMVLCFLTQPTIVKLTNSVEFAIWVGFIFCLMSVASICFLLRIDRKRDALLGIDASVEIPEEEKFKFSDIKKFRLIYWLLLVDVILVECCIFCFGNISSKYIQERFGYNSVEAGAIISIPVVLGAISSPLIGVTVDKIGKRVLMLIAAAVVITACQLFLLITPDSHKPIAPTFYLCIFGLGNSLFNSVFWGALSYVVDKKILGTANGCIYSLRSMALVITPIVMGYLIDNTEKYHGYFWVSFFLGSLSGLGIVNGIIIFINDIRNGGVLHSSKPSAAQAKYITAHTKKPAIAPDIQLISIN